MAALPELVNMSEEQRVCPMFDGWGAEIEAIVDGKSYRFNADNTDQCDATRRADDILDLIINAFYKKDRD